MRKEKHEQGIERMIRNKLPFQRTKRKNVESVGEGSEGKAHGEHARGERLMTKRGFRSIIFR